MSGESGGSQNDDDPKRFHDQAALGRPMRTLLQQIDLTYEGE